MDETTPRTASRRPAPSAGRARRSGASAAASPAAAGPGDSGATTRVLTDPRAIRALAHPARLAVLEAFSGGRELTATAAAEVAGMSASAMSYHLRALEKWGFVERAQASADGRERPWRATAERWRIDEMPTAATAAAADTMLGTVLDRVRAGLAEWFHREQGQPQQWRDAAVVDSATVWVTPDEVAELTRLVGDWLEEKRSRTADDHPEAARRVRVAHLTVPIDFE